MFGSQVLDVVIGIVFIYLLLSIICTAVIETIAALFSLRARNLAKGIANLLEDKRIKGLAELFYDHPLIKSLYKGGRKPSYIPSRTFALAFLDGVAPAIMENPDLMAEMKSAVADLPADSELKRVLVLFLQDAGGDINKLRTNIETWFDDAMARVAGWYKRKTQVIIFVLAIVLTGATNADTIQIVKNLLADPALRASLVAQAQQLAKQQDNQTSQPKRESGQTGPTRPVTGELTAETVPNSALPQNSYESVMQALKSLQQPVIPLGWQRAPAHDEWLGKIIGLLLTIFAISLGAPFWFDVLSKVAKLRATGASAGSERGRSGN